MDFSWYNSTHLQDGKVEKCCSKNSLGSNFRDETKLFMRCMQSRDHHVKSYKRSSSPPRQTKFERVLWTLQGRPGQERDTTKRAWTLLLQALSTGSWKSDNSLLPPPPQYHAESVCGYFKSLFSHFLLSQDRSCCLLTDLLMILAFLKQYYLCIPPYPLPQQNPPTCKDIPGTLPWEWLQTHFLHPHLAFPRVNQQVCYAVRWSWTVSPPLCLEAEGPPHPGGSLSVDTGQQVTEMPQCF